MEFGQRPRGDGRGVVKGVIFIAVLTVVGLGTAWFLINLWLMEGYGELAEFLGIN